MQSGSIPVEDLDLISFIQATKRNITDSECVNNNLHHLPPYKRDLKVGRPKGK